MRMKCDVPHPVLNVVLLLLGFVNSPIVFNDCVHESNTTTVIIVMTSSINDFFFHTFPILADCRKFYSEMIA